MEFDADGMTASRPGGILSGNGSPGDSINECMVSTSSGLNVSGSIGSRHNSHSHQQHGSSNSGTNNPTNKNTVAIAGGHVVHSTPLTSAALESAFEPLTCTLISEATNTNTISRKSKEQSKHSSGDGKIEGPLNDGPKAQVHSDPEENHLHFCKNLRPVHDLPPLSAKASTRQAAKFASLGNISDVNDARTLKSSEPLPLFTENGLVERNITVALINLTGFHNYVFSTPTSKVIKEHEYFVNYLHEVAKRCGGVLDTFNGDKFWVSFNAATVCNDAPIAATMFACVVDKALNAKSICTPSGHNNNNNSNSLNDFQSTPSRNPSIELLPPGLPAPSAPSPPTLKHPNAKSPIIVSTPTHFHPQLLDIGSDAGSANSIVAPSVHGVNSGIATNAAASLGCTIGVAKGLGYVGALGTSTIKRHTVISNAMSEASALERMATKYPDCKVLIGEELIPFVEGYFQYVMLDASALPGSGGLRNRVAGVKGLMLQPGFMFPFSLRTEVCKLTGSSSSHTSNEAILSAIASLPHFNPFADINHCFMLYLEGRAEEAMMRLQVIGAQVAASSNPTHGPVGLDGRPIAGEGTTSTPYPQHPYQQQQYRQRAGGVKPLSADEASSISLVMECLDMLIRSMDGRVYQSPLGVLF
eukprot:GILJ01014385.1.p1 GENE.GILJ01014385.1~~GILJ01014385.1.p1  ORF type:complete len:642 (+),score=80.98 GILJ01014385.1:228-2153(+)